MHNDSQSFMLLFQMFSYRRYIYVLMWDNDNYEGFYVVYVGFYVIFVGIYDGYATF
jgi:hypothetical protein